MDSQTLGDISGRTDVEWSFSTLLVQAPVTEPVKRGCMSIASTHTASVWTGDCYCVGEEDTGLKPSFASGA